MTGVEEPPLEPRALFDATVGADLRARLERLPPEKQHDPQALDELRAAYRSAWGLTQRDKPLVQVAKSENSSSDAESQR